VQFPDEVNYEIYGWQEYQNSVSKEKITLLTERKGGGYVNFLSYVYLLFGRHPV
jgi:hypothetical protein